MTSQRRAEMFLSEEADPRIGGQTVGDERAMLVDFLNAQRATLRLTCAGLHAELATRSVEPSTLSLLGLVRHLADVERRWFRQVLAGQPVSPRFAAADDPDGDFNGALASDEVIAQAWTALREEIAFADEFIANAPDLDVSGADDWRGEVSLRWVLIHLVEEYARHNGHADLLRERIDGSIGL